MKEGIDCDSAGRRQARETPSSRRWALYQQQCAQARAQFAKDAAAGAPALAEHGVAPALPIADRLTTIERKLDEILVHLRGASR